MSFRKDNRGVIRLGDTTDHGGVVITAHQPKDMGRRIACVGDMVRCPRCKGVYPIVEGDPYCKIEGDRVAFHWHNTACGAHLIASVGDAASSPGGQDG
jgi:uncharacterized Zn-binding protein involved in type VI secretion